MLKSWSIQNFKPILDSGTLKLAPVTVLAGRNSSGKSSLIQSILMIAQTLSSRILDRALLPNGPIVQLGTFEDILSELTSSRLLSVGFELEMKKEELRSPSNARLDLTHGGVIAGLNTGIKSVRITSQFRSASNNGSSSSAIEASKVNVESVSLAVTVFPYRELQLTLFPVEEEPEQELEFRFDIKRLSPSELSVFLKDISSEYLRLVPYTTNETNYLGTFPVKNSVLKSHTPDPSLIAFSHFLPTRLIGKYIVEERRKSLLMRNINVFISYPSDVLKKSKVFAELIDTNATFPEKLRDTLSDLCQNEDIAERFSGLTIGDLIDWYRSLKNVQEQERFSNKLTEIIVQSILEQSPQAEKGIEALEAVTNNIYVESLEGGIEQITQFFASKIRYLGPLRADPQAVQRFAPTSELDDVGEKGEYAAAVYEANQNARIQWYNPFIETIEKSTLKVALDTWVSYLGIANEVKIQMAGQSGVSWQVVHIKGHKALPLTAVGVGVSQILPILVMGLLAPYDTMLLVEQPELHLHPTVQARLGDFFMGLAKCDKQCLIETHSENLISQLRYHVVQAGGQENSDCLIYFVDQDTQGATQFNPIKISQQGNILNWPDGFFDETMLQEDRITTASLKKRVQKAHNG